MGRRAPDRASPGSAPGPGPGSRRCGGPAAAAPASRAIAAQSIAVECAEVLVGDHPLEERARRGTRGGRRGRHGLEALLAVGAVHAGDAGRDVALAGRCPRTPRRAPGLRMICLQLLEDREQQLQGHLGLVPLEGLLAAPSTRCGVDPAERRAAATSGVGVVERVLAPAAPRRTRKRREIFSRRHADRRRGQRGQARRRSPRARGARTRQRRPRCRPARAATAAQGPHAPAVLGEQVLQISAGNVAPQRGGVAGRPEARRSPRRRRPAAGCTPRGSACAGSGRAGRGARSISSSRVEVLAQLALRTDLVEVDREDPEELLDLGDRRGSIVAPEQR